MKFDPPLLHPNSELLSFHPRFEFRKNRVSDVADIQSTQMETSVSQSSIPQGTIHSDTNPPQNVGPQSRELGVCF